MLDFDVMLLVTSVASSVAVVDTSREPYTKHVGFRFMLLVTSRISSFAVVDPSREPYPKNVGFRSHVACNS